MRGVLLAGGKGTRLLPATRVMNKHMVPILNRPMITYPLETLKSLGCTDILIVSGGEHIGQIAEFLGDGERYGVSLTYRVQKEAGGIAQAIQLAEDFTRGENFFTILGDNVFGANLKIPVGDTDPDKQSDLSTIFLKHVEDANRFGVFDTETRRIVEKPEDRTAGYAVTGLYHYTPEIYGMVRSLSPSARGELEITDVNNLYLERGRQGTIILPTDVFWSDAGTPESLARTTAWAAERL